MTFTDSYNMIKELRPIVNPNTSFVKQLKTIKSKINIIHNLRYLRSGNFIF